MQVHLYQNDPDRAGFYIEWSIIPTAICAYYEERESYKRPMITWGIHSDRVDVPPRSPLRATGSTEIPKRYGLPTSTPFIMPWRHLAMYIEDGDPAELSGMLAELEVSFADHELVVWWRQRLDARLAEVGSR